MFLCLYTLNFSISYLDAIHISPTFIVLAEKHVFCPPPPHKKWATVHFKNTAVGDIATYTCMLGYYFTDGGTSRATVCQRSGILEHESSRVRW